MRWLPVVGALTAALACSSAISAFALDSPVSTASFTSSSVVTAHFEEPLVTTGPTTAAEDAALEAAVARYNARTAADDVGTLESFISAHPKSAWNAALHTNLGLFYYHYGYLSKAIDAWEAAWKEGQSASEPRAKALVDRAVGELARMHARLGHAERLDALLKETDSRQITGPATEALTGAREGLWVMRNKPGDAYLCGPNGLRNLLISLKSLTKDDARLLEDYHSGPHGVSLAQLSDLADQLKLPHRIIYRSPDQPVPVPSVIHWKVNHFAALVGHENGRYHLSDPTFGDDLWISESALQQESSGYYLVPEKSQTFAWRDARPEEQREVFGMGVTSTNEPFATLAYGDVCTGCAADGSSTTSEEGSATTPPADPNMGGMDPDMGMATYAMTEMVVSLHITDSPVGYAPPRGPGVFTLLSYNQREANQPANFTYFNVSPKWTLNWLAYIQDDPRSPGATVSRYAAGGGTVSYTGFTSTGTFQPETRDASILAFSGKTGPVSYIRSLQSGAKEIYAQSDGSTSYPRKIFLSQMVDPAGNILTLHYDAQLRLTSITDATGRDTTFTYGLTAQPLLVTAITDPFGRSAKIDYNSKGQLVQITDTLGLQSKFSYDAQALVNSMTTPYGTTSFVYGSNGNQRYLQATDPLGHTERLEFLQYAPGIPYSDPPSTIPVGLPAPFNAYLYGRDTFYWDKHAYAVAAGDYTKARNRHWTHEASNNSVTNHTVESIKYPLESRLWMYYPGESSTGFSGTYDKPSYFGRVLDDGSTQLYKKTYNPQGHVTDSIDPLGRETQTTYAANGIDPITVKQKTSATGYSTTAQFTYNSQHLPLTSTDAAGQTTSYLYNSAGQLTQMTDALGETTTYAYDPLGYLTTITNANGKTQTSFTYDALGRVATATDSEGYIVNYDYDPLNRVTKETFPDGTTRQYGYTALDLTSVTDRQGQVTQYSYDGVRNLVQTVDPLQHVTKYVYFENQTLKSLTDPNGNTTAWTIDIENRVTGKLYADGSQVANAYEATTSRLHAVTDALKQVKTFTYANDDLLTGTTYTKSVNATPNVSFTYDPYFPRVATMTDGTGITKYTYQAIGAAGALQLSSEVGPFTNATVSYQYDPLSRLSTRTVDTTPETFSYDPLSRLSQHQTPIGNFALTYLGETSQLASQSSGTYVGTHWNYEANINDRRLKAIVNDGVARSYAFKTTPENLISTIEDLPPWDKSGTLHDGGPAWQYTYDDNYRLTHASSPFGKQYDYSYDQADNITAETIPDQSNRATYNNLNEFATINNVGVSYDANGNLLDDGFSKAYQWDAENRLIKVTHKDNSALTTTFRYDGLGRRIVMNNSGPSSPGEMHYLWCGESLCQSRTASDSVSRRYYSEGEYLANQGLGLYYATDQLGSVRDVLWSNEGLPLATANYDPYGVVRDSVGLVQTDFQYGKMFVDRQDDLDLANFRVYNPHLRRWLSRDPIGEEGGLNLAAYVGNDPVDLIDPLGLCNPKYKERCDSWRIKIDNLKAKIAERQDAIANNGVGRPPLPFNDPLELIYPSRSVQGHLNLIATDERRVAELQALIDKYCGDDSGGGDGEPITLPSTFPAVAPPSPATQMTVMGIIGTTVILVLAFP